jgi:hypothetical protein
LFVSGRASFELVQKAWAAGFGTLVAVSAPTAWRCTPPAAPGWCWPASCAPIGSTSTRPSASALTTGAAGSLGGFARSLGTMSEPIKPSVGRGVLHLFCKATPLFDGEASSPR